MRQSLWRGGQGYTRTGNNVALAYLNYEYYKTGNVKTLTDTLDASRTQSFIYEELNRLTQANSPAYPASIGLKYYPDERGYRWFYGLHAMHFSVNEREMVDYVPYNESTETTRCELKRRFPERDSSVAMRTV